ncbi:hypothetical protein [Erythrobacter litoralis]|nr:hypothetical protein [Erythrobacter litoralis]
MRSLIILQTGAALLALIAAPPLLAQGKGNDKNAGGPPAAAQKDRGKPGGGGPPSAGRGNAGKERGGPPGQAGARDPRGNPRQEGGNDARGRGNAGQAFDGRRGGGNPPPGGQRGSARRTDRSGDGRGEYALNFALRDLRDTFGVRPRLIGGCPPGLAKKRNGCLPPGQARQRFRNYDPGFFGLFGAERGRYFYNDGYLLRYRDDGLAGFLPLLGGALGIGNVWPSFYEPRPLPRYYSDYYRLGNPRGYRYADNVIYRVEPETAAITSVAALLTGSDIRIGRPMPRGYDVYNVPYAYRDRYYDTPQARYRYADGYIYEIDPETALVASAIELAL